MGRAGPRADRGHAAVSVPHPLREKLIEAIAEFLVTNEARKSIETQMGDPTAHAWAKMRSYTGIRGWDVTKEQAIQALESVLK